MFWATFATVFTTLLGLALIARTLHHTRRAADYAKDMVGEAKTTTAATLTLIKQEQDNAQRQLRAYVGVDTISLPNGLDRNLVVDPKMVGIQTNNLLRVMLKNFGQTPATNVVIFGYWINTEYATRLPIETLQSIGADVVDVRGTRNMVSRFILQNGKTNQVDIPIWNPAPWAGARDNTSNLYVVGRIYYRDAFDNPWRTHFCFQWYPHHRGEKFIPYEHYNYEDSEVPPSLD
ncbi:MAG: hypothetical protein ABL936_17335 [Aestuariivirga sp.]